MICTATGCYAGSCYAESPWAPEATERDRLAVAAGWRVWRDGKEPRLNSGAALCPTHAADPKELTIATAPRSKR